MDSYSLIVVTDETAPVRRFNLAKRTLQRALVGAALAALVGLAGFVDYVRVRIDQLELESLRTETAAQRDRIADFETTLTGVDSHLAKLRELERKVRIIANLPGSGGSGGVEVSEVGVEDGGDLLEGPGEGELAPAVEEAIRPGPGVPQTRSRPTGPDQRLGALRRDAERLGLVAEARSLSLGELVARLEKKRDRLASSPAIWPTKGWLTSRFGGRVSPFTGLTQFHAGIDIAGARGTAVVAPARGQVVFSGKRGPLGKSIIIDHGYGVRTLYGHNSELRVKRGEQVDRGQPIASLGSSGRSTGPHLHYVVEVNGKARNPLDYIFD